ncbi:TraC family protein [Escherichia coli]|uniref:TraC family protein n=1 Tax=Escherichia coli TaxID=562 RepID=UPI001E5DD994|nr:TraC family protein [Escherichia coli]MCE3670436.1 TraC family protein [Escherichia coli]
MNNPLEAVTQAVNSLVTALKLPDESAKANEVLGEMSFPQFSRLLPYRDYNQESGLFMNDTTMGFMLEAIPINGANESIVEALDHMLRTKLPRGIPLCIHLMSSQLVGDRIEYGLREFSWSGEQAERFNAITRAYYMKAAATQFPLPEGMNLPLTLRHYRVFISYCSPSKKKSRADILEMENLVKIIRASLQGASITTQTVDAQAFIDIVGEMINHNPDSLYPKRRQLDPYSDLNYQCVEDSFDLKVRADYLTLGLRENGRNSTARILNFHLARNPEIAFLWNVADNYSNLLNPELSISCPFILTLTLVVEDQVKTHSEANLKYMDLEKKSKTSYAKWFPSVEKEAKEWGELRQRLGSGQSSVVSYFLNITAFCKDNNETALEVEQDILNSFRKNGFELISPRFNHMRNFLTCLPFMAGKGLFKQLKEAGVVQRAESFNVANLMPLVADNPLTPAGLLAPTYRNLKKLNVIDEGWRLLDFKNHKVGEFIEKGYRTARRHTGAYITITQNIVDFDSDKASSAARAAWGNSSYKIILKQSAKEFAKYNQLYPDQFLPLQRDMIGKFGAAKDQWFSSFLLQVENHSSWHRLFVDPLSRAMYSSDGPDFEFVQQKRKEGLSIHEAVWQLAWKKSGPEMASLEAWLEEHEKYRSVA